MYERERDAYTLLSHHRVKRCIPEAYCVQEWPRWRFDGNQPDNYFTVNREEQLYGIFMDYFEDCQEIELRRGTLRLAEVLGKTLEVIHEAGVIHNDLAERNILLVRESGKVRVVWIDFSCAWSGRQFERTRSIEWRSFRGFLYQRMVKGPHAGIRSLLRITIYCRWMS
jgi:tRNA A-37 threonylcarbamoyl transferase component Bud32